MVGMPRSFLLCELKIVGGVIVVADSVGLHGRRRRRPRRRRCPCLARVSSAPATAVRVDGSLRKAPVRKIAPEYREKKRCLAWFAWTFVAPFSGLRPPPRPC